MDKKIEQKLLELVCETIGCGMDKLNDRSVLLEDLGYDSITKIQLQVEIEDEFEFLFNPLQDDFDDIFSSLERLCQYVMEQTKIDR